MLWFNFTLYIIELKLINRVAWVPQTTSAHVLNIIPLQLPDVSRCAPKFDSKLKSGQGKYNPR